MAYKTNLEQERRMLFCLNQIQQLGAVSICSLGEHFGGYSNLFNIEETDIILSVLCTVWFFRLCEIRAYIVIIICCT